MGTDGSVAAVPWARDFEDLSSRYSPALYRVAFRRLGNREDAEDAVQEALLSAFTHISQFGGRSCLSTWLHRIVFNSAGMQLRRRKNRTFLSLEEPREKEGSSLEDRLADSGPTPEQAFGLIELHDLVHQSLKDLSPQLRKALQMRHLDGLSVAESAQVVGITKSALKTRAQRGRRQLGKLIGTRCCTAVSRGNADA
jgi:RNA polymerase sigma-70 factor (ECF subfamily)